MLKQQLLIRLVRKFPVRLILSVIAGIATSMILSEITREILHLCGVFESLRKPMFDTPLVILSLVYHSVYAIIAAFITAMLAKKQARKAVFILGSKEAIMWLIGILLLWKHAPAWYNLSKAVLGIPLAWIGGKLYELYKKKKERGIKSQESGIQTE